MLKNSAFPRRTRAFAVVLCGFLIASAAGCRGPQVCAQGYVQEVPLIRIAAAQSSVAVNPPRIPQLTFSNILVNGRTIPRGDMSLYLTSRSVNVMIQDSNLICTIACSFGADMGTYTFTASAPGYVSKEVIIPNARYTQFEKDGECSGQGFGGPEVTIILDPA